MRLAALITVLGMTLFAPEVLSGDRNPPTPYQTGRSVTVARNGIVATSHPIAAQVGLDVLKHGGNAVDAAIATSAAMGLMEPMSCGIGGDLFAIVWDAKTQTLHGLHANGRAPLAVNIKWFHEQGYTEIPTLGPLSWSVPGCVDGWDELRRKFGTKSWPDLLAPAIHYAEEGFPVSEIIGAGWAGDAPALARVPTSAACFLPGGRAPGIGEVF